MKGCKPLKVERIKSGIEVDPKLKEEFDVTAIRRKMKQWQAIDQAIRDWLKSDARPFTEEIEAGLNDYDKKFGLDEKTVAKNTKPAIVSPAARITGSTEQVGDSGGKGSRQSGGATPPEAEEAALLKQAEQHFKDVAALKKRAGRTGRALPKHGKDDPGAGGDSVSGKRPA